MDWDDELAKTAERTAHRLQGRGALALGPVAYSPTIERALLARPSFSQTRTDLQNADGSFKFAPADDGSLTAGKFGIDSYGRFVTIP